MRRNFTQVGERLRAPPAAALTDKCDTRTYAERWARGVGFAAGLVPSWGLQRQAARRRSTSTSGSRPSSSIFGTSAAAGVFVPVNPVLRAKQVGHILADCDVRVLVTSRRTA